MEAKALCESIFQFVGPLRPEHASTSQPSTDTAGRASEVGEGATAAEAAATRTTHDGQPTTEDERYSNASPRHQMENEEIIRAFVGNKARGWVVALDSCA